VKECLYFGLPEWRVRFFFLCIPTLPTYLPKFLAFRPVLPSVKSPVLNCCPCVHWHDLQQSSRGTTSDGSFILSLTKMFFSGVFAMQFEKTGSPFVVMSVCHVEQLGFNQTSLHEILFGEHYLIKSHLFRLSLFTLLSALAFKVHTHYRSRLVTWDDLIYFGNTQFVVLRESDNWWLSKLALRFLHWCGWGFCSDIWCSVVAQQNGTLHLTVISIFD